MSDTDYLTGYAEAERNVSDRERFCAMLYCGPRIPADVIVVCCGEDGEERTDTALELFKMRGARSIYLLGGLDDETRMGAERAQRRLMGLGVRPDCVEVDSTPTNTREQAVAIATLAEARQWNRLLLVASNYHLPRATLTLIKALTERGIDEKVRIIPVGTPGDWSKQIPGLTVTRSEQYAVDVAKVEQYSDHVAGWDDGIDYLEFWEDA